MTSSGIIPANPNVLYSDTPILGVGILQRHQRIITGALNTATPPNTGNTENEGRQFQLGTTVLLGAKAGYTGQGTRRLAMFVIASKKPGLAIKANSSVSISYPTCAAFSVAAGTVGQNGEWLNPSADFNYLDHGWVIQTTAIA